MKRTDKQNKSLHLYFVLLADALNDAGLDMRKTLKPGVEIPWNYKTVKDSKFASVELGSEIKIEALGETTGKSGKKYKDYKLMKRPAPFKEVKDIEDINF